LSRHKKSHKTSELIFGKSVPGRVASSLMASHAENALSDLPSQLRRQTPPKLPACSELSVVRHYTRLSKKNFSIDTHFYPLGSCTMKYNPRAVHKAAMSSGFLQHHPYAALEKSQGVMACLYELQAYLQIITGMPGVCLTPMAGAQGELAGVLMIHAYHVARGDTARVEMLVPDSAHGTNPASAVMAGFKIKEIPTDSEGDLDMGALEKALGPQTAGIMLTNPSTLGLFERNIERVSAMVHAAGGLLYYDGANLNALLGRVRPGDMGFDVLHLNLHKTFATPHGGGGPGSGPVAVAERLIPFLPVPRVGSSQQTQPTYCWLTEADCPQSIGRLSAFMGNVGILLRAYAYIRLLGRDGLRQVSELATLNASYLMQGLADLGLTLAYPCRRASHEFVVTFKKLAKTQGVTALHMAKRLLDYDIHAPTTYFPLLVPESWLIEPTETESKEVLDNFIEVMRCLLKEVETDPTILKGAPHTLPVTRLDDIKAAKQLDVVFEQTTSLAVES